MSSEPFLDAAVAIGRGLVADAVWHDDRCSWVGAVVEPADPSRPEYRPVGPRLYDGTAGIALFLAQLYAVVGEAPLRRTAAGALRHAAERAAALAPGDRDGLHAGPVGIAWAAVQAGALLGLEEPVAAGKGLAVEAAAARRSDSPDVVSGAAGACAGLLALGERRFLEAAVTIGDALLASATVTRDGWSWADSAARGAPHLCGAAHGAGGIAWALLELFAATGDARYAAAAQAGFAYERSWLDTATGTWPDRDLPARRGMHASSMTATWCYGEAGIALTRLRAVELLADGPHCSDADIAVETARRHLTERLPFAIHDLSLCHGAAGTADTLLTAGHADVALALGETALDRYGVRGDWPCGVKGTTPGLFRGLSGIGWFLLRLHDPSRPSPLSLPRAG